MDVVEEAHEEERNGKKEHVTFAIFQKKLKCINALSSVSDKGPQINNEVCVIGRNPLSTCEKYLFIYLFIYLVHL